MKKILLPVLMLALLAACEKETVAPVQDATAADIDFRDDDCPATVEVWHKRDGQGYILIEICEDALPAHLAHGDYEPGGGGFVDNDGDGFPSDEDCDDNNPAINPAAQEVIDGYDNDCDGLVDPNAASYVNSFTWIGNDYLSLNIKGGRAYDYATAKRICENTDAEGGGWSFPLDNTDFIEKWIQSLSVNSGYWVDAANIGPAVASNSRNGVNINAESDLSSTWACGCFKLK